MSGTFGFDEALLRAATADDVRRGPAPGDRPLTRRGRRELPRSDAGIRLITALRTTGTLIDVLGDTGSIRIVRGDAEEAGRDPG